MNKEINIMNKELLDNKSNQSLISISTINSDYYKIFSDIHLHNFIYINFGFANASNANLANHEIEEEIEYNRRIKYNNKITNYIYNEYIIFGTHYKLIDIINTPNIHHYKNVLLSI